MVTSKATTQQGAGDGKADEIEDPSLVHFRACLAGALPWKKASLKAMREWREALYRNDSKDGDGNVVEALVGNPMPASNRRLHVLAHHSPSSFLCACTCTVGWLINLDVLPVLPWPAFLPCHPRRWLLLLAAVNVCHDDTWYPETKLLKDAVNMHPIVADDTEKPVASAKPKSAERKGGKTKLDDDARINELVNESVAARLAEITRQQDEQQQRTDHVRSGNDHETRHQQHAGRPSAGPSADDIARTLANALTSRLQISPADTGRVPSSAATLRMTEVKRLAPWDGQKERCDKFGRDLNEMVPVKNLGELRWYSACIYERDVERGLLEISQQRFAEELAAEYVVEWGQSVPLPVSVELSDFDVNEASGDVPFRELKCVTLSTTEAEYVAIADVVKEVLFLRQVWRLMLQDASMPCIPVFEDNQGAIQIAHNPITNSNSKHIDVRHHFIRELIERTEIATTHVPT
ncbi:unnamed protein product [Ectocarpus sp. CCAP 1310/34]|nr:unnamed protein product [Ectocarpus sp. CCAP 1310/34]